MAVRTDFAAGEVLAAQDLDDTFAAKVNYALPVNAQTGSGASAYTFVLADALRLTTTSNASAGTYTIPPQSSVVWLANSVIRIVNYGAGTVTIAGGAGVTVTNATTTLAQFESAALIRTASNAWTLVPFSGAGSANFSNAATGTYTDSGINYKYVTFTGSGTLTVTKAGLADVLLVAGAGGGGGSEGIPGGDGGSGGGAGGFVFRQSIYLLAGSNTITIGGGGAGTTGNSALQSFGANGGDTLAFGLTAVGGGGGGNGNGESTGGMVGRVGGSGGGNCTANGSASNLLSIGVSGQGTAGGLNTARPGGGGGGSSSAGSNSTGGSGTSNSLTNAPLTYSAGGGGGFGGSVSGAGNGGGSSGAGGNGGANTGNGGGGAGAGSVAVSGGSGGSGVVIVRVRV